MNTFKAFKYLADTRGELHMAVQILTEMDYPVPPLPQVNPGRYNVIRTTVTGNVEFLPQDVFDLIALPAISLKGLREMVGEQKDARIAELEQKLEQERKDRAAELRYHSDRYDGLRNLYLRKNSELEAQLKQSQHNVEHHAARAQRAESLYHSKSEVLDRANGKLLKQREHIDELTDIRNREQEYCWELKNKLHFRDQVIDSQKRRIGEWHQAYARVSKELKDLQAENEDLSKWSQEASQTHANVLDRLDGLETKIIESHRNHKAVCELKDIRIANLERELNTCKANYDRLLWMED